MPPDRLQATLGVDGVQERQLARLVARVGNRKNVVLELDETGVTLCVWYWCVSQLHADKHLIQSYPFLNPGQSVMKESVSLLLTLWHIEILINSEDRTAYAGS
jgi:hypothetical protein